jgi:hypothetical protein
MDRPIQTIEWKRPDDDHPTDVTDAVTEAYVSSTPHPDDAIDHPKGYSVKLTLKSDSTAFAKELQEALMNFETAEVSLHLEDVDTPISNVPVGISKMPHLGEQNEAELGIKPEGHDKFHDHF